MEEGEWRREERAARVGRKGKNMHRKQENPLGSCYVSNVFSAINRKPLCGWHRNSSALLANTADA